MAFTTRHLRLMGAVVVVLTAAAAALSGAAFERVRRGNVERDGASTDRRGEIECDRDQRDRRPPPYSYLNLSPEQRAAIDAVLEEQRKRTGEIWREYRPRYDSVIDATRAAVRELLTDEQRAEQDRRRRAFAVRDSIRREEYRRKCGEPPNRENQSRGTASAPLGPSRNR